MAVITKICIADKMREILFYKRAYENSSQNALWHYMVEYFTKRYSDLAKEKLGTDILDTQLAYSIRFYCMGSVGMTPICSGQTIMTLLSSISCRIFSFRSTFLITTRPLYQQSPPAQFSR